MVLAFVLGGTLVPDLAWNLLQYARQTWSEATRIQPLTPAPVRREPVPAAATLEPYLDRDAYAVMSAWKQYWAPGNAIIVRQEVVPDWHLQNDPPNLACLPKGSRYAYADAMNDLAGRWNDKWRLTREGFANAEEIILVPESQLPVNDQREGLPANARGYFGFSTVGFSHSRKKAIAYVIHRDGRYGMGEVFLLSKTARDEWVVAGSGRCGWIA